MIIENLNGLTVLYAEGNNKITNVERSFFTDMIYLGKNDSVENYQEVPRDIWKHFIEDKPTDFDILQEKINDLSSGQVLLEETLLDSDFRLLDIELKIELSGLFNDLEDIL